MVYAIIYLKSAIILALALLSYSPQSLRSSTRFISKDNTHFSFESSALRKHSSAALRALAYSSTSRCARDSPYEKANATVRTKTRCETLDYSVEASLLADNSDAASFEGQIATMDQRDDENGDVEMVSTQQTSAHDEVLNGPGQVDEPDDGTQDLDDLASGVTAISIADPRGMTDQDLLTWGNPSPQAQEHRLYFQREFANPITRELLGWDFDDGRVFQHRVADASSPLVLRTRQSLLYSCFSHSIGPAHNKILSKQLQMRSKPWHTLVMDPRKVLIYSLKGHPGMHTQIYHISKMWSICLGDLYSALHFQPRVGSTAFKSRIDGIRDAIFRMLRHASTRRRDREKVIYGFFYAIATLLADVWNLIAGHPTLLQRENLRSLELKKSKHLIANGFLKSDFGRHRIMEFINNLLRGLSEDSRECYICRQPWELQRFRSHFTALSREPWNELSRDSCFIHV